MAALDPGLFRSRIAALDATKYGIATSWHDVLTTDAVALQEAYEAIPSAELTGSGNEQAPEPGAINLDGLTQTLELNPAAHWPYIAALLDNYDTNVLEAGVSFEHLIAPSRGTAWAPFGTAVDWTLDGSSVGRIRPAFIREMTITWAGNNARVTAAVSFAAERLDVVAAGAIVTGTPPVTPHIQGLPTEAELLAADPVLYIQVTDVAASPVSVEIKAKQGAATAYGTPTQTLVAGQRLRLLNPNGTRMGTTGAYLEAILADVSGLTALDEWSFNLSTGVWTRVLPAQIPLTSPMVTVRLDSEVFRVTQGSVTITKPVEYNPTTGSRFADDAISNVGNRTIRWNLQRIAADASGVQLLRNAASVEIEAALESGSLVPGGADANYFGVDLISKNCLPFTGSTPGQISATNVQDTLIFSAHESTDPTYPDPLTARVVNDVADLSV